MRIIFFGPPGSGKDTQANILSKNLDIPHISTGVVLRESSKNKDKKSIDLKYILASGNLVSDEILNDIVSKKLLTENCRKGFILDGYPRTKSQFEFFISFINNNNIKLDLIINFRLNEEIIKKRIMERSRLEKRMDDNIDIIKNRLEKYKNETRPLISISKTKFSNILFDIEANQEISKIQDEIINMVKNAQF